MEQPTTQPAGELRQDLCRIFPSLCTVEDAALTALLAACRAVELPAGAAVFRDGDACHHYLLVLDGVVRVQKLAPNGREVVLYRVAPGETCVLTTSCLMGHSRYPAEAVTEAPVRAVMLPAGAFQAALADAPAFRGFVFEAYGRRIADLILRVEEISWGRLDTRLAQRLLDQAGDGAAHVTHQSLAAELGTAREVVSRHLKDFERRGWVDLQRARIVIRNLRALEELAALAAL